MDLFAVGEIVKTRGLRGCLKVLCYVETNNTFAELEFVYIEISSGKKNRFVLRKIDVSGKILFIELEGIPDVESAQALVGCKVFLPEDTELFFGIRAADQEIHRLSFAFFFFGKG